MLQWVLLFCYDGAPQAHGGGLQRVASETKLARSRSISNVGMPQIHLFSELQICVGRWLSSSVDLLETAAHLKQAGNLPSHLELWATENPNVNPASRFFTKASHFWPIAGQLIQHSDDRFLHAGLACFRNLAARSRGTDEHGLLKTRSHQKTLFNPTTDSLGSSWAPFTGEQVIIIGHTPAAHL